MRVGDTWASRPELVGDGRDAAASGTGRTRAARSVDAVVLQERGAAAQRLPRVVARHLPQRASSGTPLRRAGSWPTRSASVKRSPGWLPPVTTITRRQVLLVELDGVVEPGLRAPATAGRRTGRRRARRWPPPARASSRRDGPPHLDERDAEVQHRPQDATSDRERPPQRPDDAASRRPRASRAARSRSSVAPGRAPRATRTAAGPTVRPVTATRIGAWALPSLSPCRSRRAAMACVERVAVPRRSRRRRRRRRRARRRRACGLHHAFSHDVASISGSSRRGKSTVAGTSASDLDPLLHEGRQRLEPAPGRSLGRPRWSSSSHGRSPARRSSTGRARMYSALMWSSFLTSKNAGDGFDVLEPELLDDLVERADLDAVGRAPAEQGEVVDHRLGQVARGSR